MDECRCSMLTLLGSGRRPLLLLRWGVRSVGLRLGWLLLAILRGGLRCWLGHLPLGRWPGACSAPCMSLGLPTRPAMWLALPKSEAGDTSIASDEPPGCPSTRDAVTHLALCVHVHLCRLRHKPAGSPARDCRHAARTDRCVSTCSSVICVLLVLPADLIPCVGL